MVLQEDDFPLTLGVYDGLLRYYGELEVYGPYGPDF